VLSNASVTRDGSLIYDFRVPRGSLGCRILTSLVTTVHSSFMSPEGLFGLSNPCLTRDSSLFMFYEFQGLFGLSNPCVTRDSSSLMISKSQGADWAIASIRHP
jgi:hypothetical protein